ncbi:hypothetical protein ACIGXM_03670 [Kitasatospora sp. NPDC052896]|uniref:hypothetical protein n=1 Tax=Kitasatospora sp. NPDC052896 TaxID=3364061 RepID=UPI0037C81FC4
MKLIVAGQRAGSAFEFAELALGVDGREFDALFAGVWGESPEEWAARTDVAREVLAELWETDPESAAVAAELLRSAPVPIRRMAGGRRSGRAGVAA